MSTPSHEVPLEIGILTRGKPTLGMALASLLLQDGTPLRIYVVDTSETPVINREDIVFALRLAFDREIQCGYEYSRERERAFSLGKLRLLENLRGPFIAFVDDDIVIPSSTLRAMRGRASDDSLFGYIAPTCKNAVMVNDLLAGQPHYSPGGVIHQDEAVRAILSHYYATTVDVLDRQRSDEKVWETAFLTELFAVLERPRITLPDALTYHLDYSESPDWELARHDLVRRSASKARELVKLLHHP